MLNSFLAPYRKFVVAFAGFLAVLGAAGQDGEFSTSEISSVVSAGAAVVAVFLVKNAPREP
jgi:hypothetical protein